MSYTQLIFGVQSLNFNWHGLAIWDLELRILDLLKGLNSYFIKTVKVAGRCEVKDLTY